MSKAYSIAQLRENLSDVTQRVHHKSDVVDVVYYRKPWVSVVSPEKGRLARFVDSPQSGSDETLKYLKRLIDQVSADGSPVSLGQILDKLMEEQEKPDRLPRENDEASKTMRATV